MVRLTGEILCQIPPEYRIKLANGSLKLIGSVIRDSQTGRIVGFLQESGALSQSLGGLARLANPFGSLAGLALQAGQVVQNEAIRSGVNRLETQVDAATRIIETIPADLKLLQNLGVANLALGATGIGVSVVGFGIMTAKINAVQQDIAAMQGQLHSISSRIERVHQDMIEADFLAVHSLSRLYEEGWGFTDLNRAEQQWLRISHEARSLQDRFAWRARELLNTDLAHVATADRMIDAANLASGLRVASLVACNEGALAETVAAEAAMQVEAITGSIGLAELTHGFLPEGKEAGTSDYEIEMTRARDAARPLLNKLREREAATATRTAPLQLLAERKIAPRAWLEAARNETQEPVLMLLADDLPDR